MGGLLNMGLFKRCQGQLHNFLKIKISVTERQIVILYTHNISNLDSIYVILFQVLQFISRKRNYSRSIQNSLFRNVLLLFERKVQDLFF